MCKEKLWTTCASACWKLEWVHVGFFFVPLRNKQPSHTHLICTYTYAHVPIRIRTYAGLCYSLLLVFYCVVLLEKTNEISL